MNTCRTSVRQMRRADSQIKSVPERLISWRGGEVAEFEAVTLRAYLGIGYLLYKMEQYFTSQGNLEDALR